MDPVHLRKLLQEQEKGLETSQETLLQWEKFREDYKSLKETLRTLPHKVTHDVMVPFGPLAFAPGTLRHTNEILVLLGDNWFAERSCHQAVEIVDRRIEQCDDHIKKLKEEQRLLKSWQEQTESLQKDEYLSELTEPYDEEKEKQWRERHKMLAAEERKKRKEKGTKDNHDDYMKRLEELELLEEMKNEMLEDDDDDDEDDEDDDESDDDRDEYAEPVPEQQTEDQLQRTSQERVSLNEKCTKPPSVITFRHTPDERQIVSEDSPADVYKFMEQWTASKPLKSILKRSQSLGVCADSGSKGLSQQNEPCDLEDQKSVQFHLPEKQPRTYEAFCNWFKSMEGGSEEESIPKSKQFLNESTAFSDKVVETSVKKTPQEEVETRPMSRFKALRSKK